MENGIILIDKEIGFTSREVDNAIMKLFSSRHVGHLGTLDPFASGLLVLGLNKGTKYLPYLDDSMKSYIAKLSLGESTTTGDTEGEKKEEKGVPPLSAESIAEVLKSFLGDIEQVPPMTSAIKINGEELYKKAHRGEVVPREPRKVHVFTLNLISFDRREIVFSCTVGTGTYIRTLGEDIAIKLGTVGHLVSLRRLGIGPFLVNAARTLDKVSAYDVLNPAPFVTTMPRLEIDEATAKKAKNGVALELKDQTAEKVLLSQDRVGIAVYKRAANGLYVSERGLFE